MSIDDRRNDLNNALGSGSNGIDLAVLGEGGSKPDNFGIPEFAPPQLGEANNVTFDLNGLQVTVEQNGNIFAINGSGECIRGEELNQKIKQAFENGYFQIINLAPNQIDLIGKAIYGEGYYKQKTNLK